MQQCWPIFAYMSNMDPHHNSHQNPKIRLTKEFSSVTTTQQTLPMAYNQPTYSTYDSTSRPTEQREYTAVDPTLPHPTITYCPPWPPPHWQRRYSINVPMILPWSPQQSYMTQQNVTQYYQWQHMQYGVDYLDPPSPAADERTYCDHPN